MPAPKSQETYLDEFFATLGSEQRSVKEDRSQVATTLLLEILTAAILPD